MSVIERERNNTQSVLRNCTKSGCAIEELTNTRIDAEANAIVESRGSTIQILTGVHHKRLLRKHSSHNNSKRISEQNRVKDKPSGRDEGNVQ